MVCNKEKLRGTDDKCAFENFALKLGVSTDEFFFHSNLGRILKSIFIIPLQIKNV